MVADDFATDGISVCDGAVPSAYLSALRDLPGFSYGCRPGSRGFGPCREVSDVVGLGRPLAKIAAGLMGAPARAVRVLYFDKRPDANWAVPWHQDRTIAVADRVEMPGFGPWSMKAGVYHVEPPEEILRNIISLRLHLDDCGLDNGPLLALRGSFRLGRVPVLQVQRHVENGPIRVCCARVGDVVAMRGLTIHASQRASRPGHRRVLHVDFSCAELPGSLRWAWT
ncbi:MAG: phytanoyl-CoA dioxygenase family protein [Hyphomicrobiaceae bacterium]|nr:phytanoyl-CoA dioxygenase family protein [Hyphomicrobiaceae bacterium]